MKITKLTNGQIIVSENLTVRTRLGVVAEAEVELEAPDAEEIRDHPFDHEFEFDSQGRLTRIRKGARTIIPKRIRNI